MEKVDQEQISTLLSKISNQDDQKAFETLFKLYFEKLLNFSKNYISQKELAEEIVSDVFVKLWKNRKSLLEIKSIHTYLYIATKNQSLNAIDKYQKRPVFSIDKSFYNKFHFSSDPGSALEYKELQSLLNTAVEKLPFQSKMVFKLVKEDGLKYKEVASILDISPRTVETHLVRAVKKLEVSLEDYLAKKKKLKKHGQIISIIFFLFFLLPL
ncbi:MAG: RNA polymerase sigma-70 factor [Thalassobius sp.]|nr:RNA polymerase sigma-70 factor [Thalassovita sp.]